MAAMAKKQKRTTAAPRITNRRARHDYHIVESLECGIELQGSEVKSLRDGKASIAEAFAHIDPRSGELWLYHMDIPPYPNAPVTAHEPKRPRKLLVHKKERDRLAGLTATKGMTLVPLTVYFNHRGIAKVDLAVAEGKAKHDKRASIKEKEDKRDMRKAMTRRKLR